MNVNRQKKHQQIKEIKEDFERSESFFLLNFSNMPVSQAVTLRRQMRENAHSLRVVKNRLALRALKEDFPEEIKDCFREPTAIAATGDPVGLARLIREFTAQHKVLEVKAGYIEGQFMPKERFEEIATLGSKTDLIARLGFLMSYPLTQLLRTWQAPFRTFGDILRQLKSKK